MLLLYNGGHKQIQSPLSNFNLQPLTTYESKLFSVAKVHKSSVCKTRDTCIYEIPLT
jgi:hypothetical protein